MLNRNAEEERRDRQIADEIAKMRDDALTPRIKPRRFKDYWKEWQRIRLSGDVEESSNLSSETKTKTDWYIIPLKNLKDLERDTTVDYERYREVLEKLSSDFGASED